MLYNCAINTFQFLYIYIFYVEALCIFKLAHTKEDGGSGVECVNLFFLVYSEKKSLTKVNNFVFSFLHVFS